MWRESPEGRPDAHSQAAARDPASSSATRQQTRKKPARRETANPTAQAWTTCELRKLAGSLGIADIDTLSRDALVVRIIASGGRRR